MKRALIPLFATSLLVAAPAAGGIAAAASAPSPTPSVSASPAPSATPTEMPGLDSLFPGGRGRGRGRGRYNSQASPAPPLPRRIGIEGVWELALQRGSNTTYTHLKLKQQQNVLTGFYIDTNRKQFPAVGIVNGNDVRIVVTLPDGSTIVFQGTLDGTTDMVGLMTTPKEQVPFSADYRSAEDFFENLNEQPTGLQNPFPSPPP